MNSYRVRPFSPVGRYPCADLPIDDGTIFRNGPNLLVSTKNEAPGEYSASRVAQVGFELENWTPNEVGFFAAIYLGNGPFRSVTLYPLPIFDDVNEEKLEALKKNDGSVSIWKHLSDDDLFQMRSNRGLMAKAFTEYQFADWDSQKTERARKIRTAINTSDTFLMRGLLALLYSEMLFEHSQFRRAAITSSHLALDACHAFVLRTLKERGRANPTTRDAQKYIEVIQGFPPSGTTFFEDYYADRTRNFHADNRDEVSTAPFLLADDFYDLNHGLKDVYYSLLTGKIFEETIEERRPR